MKRRAFLRGSAAAAAAPFVLNGLSVKALAGNPMFEAVQAAACEDRVLVLIQMIGGNDGLNTIIPLDQYGEYQAARPNIAIAQASALKLTNATGLHPNMTLLSQMYTAGKVRVVQGVGYPVPNFSHFMSTDIWLSASDSETEISTGWMGRYLDNAYPGFPDGYPNSTMPDPLAIQVGSTISPGLEGPTANMGMAFTDPNTYFNIVNGNTPVGVGARAGAELAYVRTIGQQIERFATPVKAAAAKATNKSTKYPAIRTNPLADQLKLVAQLIAGGLKTRIYICSIAGFDTHAYQNQGGPGSPVPHGTLLQQVSVAIDAFQDDLRLLKVEERVVGMTFSEFGRRIKSNAGGGTDHGAAAPIVLFGTNVVSGILGENPTIPNAPSPEDNLPMQFDFRSVYATLMHDWFCVPPQIVASLLFRDFPRLALIKGGSTTGVLEQLADPSTVLRIAPNPVQSSATVAFTAPQGAVELSLFDSSGKQLALLMTAHHTGGASSAAYNFSSLSSGHYYIRLQHSAGAKVVPLTVQH